MLKLTPLSMGLICVAITSGLLLGFVWTNYTITFQGNIAVGGGIGEAVELYWDGILLTGDSMNITARDVQNLNAGDSNIRVTHTISNNNGHGYNFTLDLSQMPCQETDPESLWYGLWIDTVETGTDTPLHAFRVAPESNYSFDIIYTVEPLFQFPGIPFPFKLIADIELYDATPTALPDFYTMQNTETLIVVAPGVLGNDLLPGGIGVLTTTLIQDVTHGTLQLHTDGSFTYTANTGYLGTDTFIYMPSIGEVTGYSATVTITVLAHKNVAPIAAIVDVGTHNPGSNFLTQISTILNACSDPDNGPEPLSLVSVSGTAHFTAAIEGNNIRITLLPGGYYGYYSNAVGYTISDGNSTATSTMGISVPG